MIPTLYSICVCIFPSQFQIAKVPRYYSLPLGESSVTQMSHSGKVMLDFFKPTFLKFHSFISRQGIFMQRRKLATEGKGKETSAPAGAKKGLEEAA